MHATADQKSTPKHLFFVTKSPFPKAAAIIAKFKANKKAYAQIAPMLTNTFVLAALENNHIGIRDLLMCTAKPQYMRIAQHIFTQKGLEGLQQGLYTFTAMFNYGLSEDCKYSATTPMAERTFTKMLTDTGFSLIRLKLISPKNHDENSISLHAVTFMDVQEGIIRIDNSISLTATPSAKK